MMHDAQVAAGSLVVSLQFRVHGMVRVPVTAGGDIVES